jgi:serine/threonine protein kinase/formylglycine-generating enzyme required for sulfatase activity
VNAEHWRRVREVFLAALEQPAERRQAFVVEACAGDADLLLEVRRLIGADDSGSFLEPPGPERLAESLRALAGPAPGSTLGGYRLGAVLGSGGMGVVFRAVALATDRPVAIKVLPPGLHLRPQAVERFQREARAAARLSHPNIVPVLDFGREEGCYFYAMELIDGPSLAELLEARRAGQSSVRGRRETLDLTDPRACADVAALLADALEHAHQNGVLHRDVKPHNVLIDPRGTPRLVDFGLARDAEASGITREGEIAGTPHYMSPEQARSQLERIDRRTDVYSLGVVLYELLTLRRPFEGGSSQEIYYKIAHSRSVPARAVSRSVPAPLSAICSQAMRRERDERYASAADMARDLRRWLAGERVLARPPSLASRLRERALEPRALLRVGPAVLLAGLSAGWLWREGESRSAESARMPRIALDLADLTPPVELSVARGLDVPGTFAAYEIERRTEDPTLELRVEQGALRLRVEDAAGVTCEYSRVLVDGDRVELSVRPLTDDADRMVSVPASRVRVSRDVAIPQDVDFEVPPFRIDRDPVTNGEYERFIVATGRERPAGWPPPTDPQPRPDWDDLPVHFVTFLDARAYAEWVGKRLPTLWEWLTVCGAEDPVRTTGDYLAGEIDLVADGAPQGGGPRTLIFEGYVRTVRPVLADGGVPQGPYGLQFLYGNVRCWVDTPQWAMGESGLPIINTRMQSGMGLAWNSARVSFERWPLHFTAVTAGIENPSEGNGIRCVESLP